MADKDLGIRYNQNFNKQSQQTRYSDLKDFTLMFSIPSHR